MIDETFQVMDYYHNPDDHANMCYIRRKCRALLAEQLIEAVLPYNINDLNQPIVTLSFKEAEFNMLRPGEGIHERLYNRWNPEMPTYRLAVRVRQVEVGKRDYWPSSDAIERDWYDKFVKLAPTKRQKVVNWLCEHVQLFDEMRTAGLIG